MAHLVHGNAGVAAWLTFGAMRPFGLGGTAAQTRTHKLLPGVAGHTARLRVSVLHSLLLRIHLRAGGHCERYQYRNRDKSPFHRRSSLELENLPSMQYVIADFSHELQSLAFSLEIQW